MSNDNKLERLWKLQTKVNMLVLDGKRDPECVARVYQGILNESPPEPVLDFLVRVDRSVKLSYPDWFKKLEHPELECTGPAEYDLRMAVQQWLANGQERGITGDRIHTQLKKDNVLASCLNLQDGLAIQQKGIVVFRKLFANKAVFLWGSVVQDRFGNLYVPYLFDGVRVVVDWCWIWMGGSFNSNDPALCFSK